LRYDWTKSISNSSAWNSFDVQYVNGLNAKGFYGCVSDGQFIYFSPYSTNVTTLSGKTVRYDSSKNFNDPSSWIGYDLDPTNGLPAAGYRGSVFDGKYVYYAVSLY